MDMAYRFVDGRSRSPMERPARPQDYLMEATLVPLSITENSEVNSSLLVARSMRL